MAGRWPFIVGITTIVAIVAWFVLRDRTPAPPAPSVAIPTKSNKSASEITAAISAPPAPTLGSGQGAALPAVPSTPTAQATFDAQPRDDEWAPRTESELRRRMKAVRGAKLDSVECRESMCRVTVIGSEAEVGQTIADLEGARGLHGYAQVVMLTAPEHNPDGTIVMRVFPKFER